MSVLSVSGVCEKHILCMTREYALSVLSAASEKYGFDYTDAVSALMCDKTDLVRASKSSNKKEKACAVKKPRTILPWCGDVSPDCCKALKLNHNLFTQCTNSPTNGEFCKTCNNHAEKNDGKPTYGTVEDRMNVGRMEYAVGDKKVVRYSRVMDKLNITREKAEEAAKEAGVVIQEDQFKEEIIRKGRPKKETSVSDTESESSENKPKKQKKNTKVVKSTTSDDLIAALVSQQGADESKEEESNDEATHEESTTSKKPTKTDITKASLTTLKEMCVAAGIGDENKRAELQKNLRNHYGYDSDGEKKPKTKKTKPTTEPTTETTTETTTEPTTELNEDAVSDAGSEDGVEVKTFIHPKTGKPYLKDAEETIYDPKTHEPIGKWSTITEEIEEFEDELDDDSDNDGD
jgi:hypothetical protein